MTASPLPKPSTDELAESLFQAPYQPLLRAILDNSSEGLGVADAMGRLIYMNEQAQRLLGAGVTDASPTAWSERYGIFYSDGRTMCPAEKLPLYRADRKSVV